VAYKSFEELPVWNAAADLAVRTFAMTATGGLSTYSGLKDQIERAAVSISNNIAEGFNRGTREERVTFLYYALGSAGEVRSMLLLIHRLPGGAALRAHLDESLPLSQSVSRQLGAWIESLKDSQYRGPRHQNTASRTARENARRAAAFDEQLERIRIQPRPEPPQDGQGS
jgi:four helix bundle protein